MVEPGRPRRTKWAATDMFGLPPLRHTPTLPTAPGCRPTEDGLRAILSRCAMSPINGLAAPTERPHQGSSTDGSGFPPARNELEVFRGHLLKECLVLALRKGPQDRRGLLAGVPSFCSRRPRRSPERRYRA